MTRRDTPLGSPRSDIRLEDTTRWIATLIREQPPSKVIDSILSDPEAPRKVQALPSITLHRLVSSLGRADTVEIIAMASPEQVRDLLDLEIWQESRVDVLEALDWLHLITTLPAAERDLRALDVELTGFVLLSLLRIHLIDEMNESAYDEKAFLLTPDGWFALEMLTDDTTTVERVTELVNNLYQIDADDTRRLLQNLLWELSFELEEWSYRWRRGRLQDLGFADPEQALMVYAYLDPSSVHPGEGTADRTLMNDPEPTGTVTLDILETAPRVDSFFGRAIANLPPAAEERLTSMLVALGNRCLSADRVAPADVDGVRDCLQRLHDRLSLGLEHLCRGDLDQAPAVLGGVALQRISRIGHSLALDLRRGVVGLARSSVIGRGPGRVDLLDPPLREQIGALLSSRPHFYEVKTGIARPFRTRQELQQAEAWIQQAHAVAKLVDRTSLRSLPAAVTCGDLFRTALVNRLLHQEEAQPIDRESLRRFLHEFRELDGSHHRLSRLVNDHVRKWVPDGHVLHQLAATWVAALEDAVAPLDPDDPDGLDPRFVDGLWLAR